MKNTQIISNLIDNTQPLVCDAPNDMIKKENWTDNVKYLFVGVMFGIVFVKAEIISWFRIQEMFRLQSFHMYGVIGSAVVVGMISVFLIRNLILKPLTAKRLFFIPRNFKKVKSTVHSFLD